VVWKKASFSALPSSGLTIPFGTSFLPFVEMLASRQPLDLEPGVSVVPIGQEVPPGWHGGFGKDGYARFSGGNGGAKILPGATMSGFTLISRGIPTIREVQAVPDWVLIVSDHDEITEDVLEAAAAVERDLPSTTYTLGPSSLNTFGSDDHWSQLAADIERAGPMDGVGLCKVKLKRFGGIDLLVEAIELIKSLGMTPVLGDGTSIEVGSWMEACIARAAIDNAGEFNGFLKPRDRLFTKPLLFEAGDIVLPKGYYPEIDWEFLKSREIAAPERFAATQVAGAAE